MKTILIPIDFSATCDNVLKYAASLSARVQAQRIILLKSYYVSLYAQLLPSADFVQLSAENIQDERLGHGTRLAEISKELLLQCTHDIKVDIAITEEPLLRSVLQVSADENVDLLVIGSDARNSDEESYIGAQIVTIAKASRVPVLIVPANAQHHPLKNVLIPVDFSAVSRLSLVHHLQNLQFASEPQLWILNVDPKHEGHESEHAEALKTALETYDYKLFYAHDANVVKGILNFANTNDVQLIVALPGKHSFFYNLTHSSITEALALNSGKPVLILK